MSETGEKNIVESEMSNLFNGNLVLSFVVEKRTLENPKIGSICTPNIPYHPTSFMINELLKSARRSSLENFALKLHGENIVVYDNHSDKKKDTKYYRSFTQEYFINESTVDIDKKEFRLQNNIINLYNTNVKLSTVTDIIEFLKDIPDHEKIIIKLPTIGSKVIDDIIALLTKSYHKIILYKPEDDIRNMDSFYVMLNNKITNRYIEELYNKLVSDKDKDANENNVYIQNLYDYESILLSPLCKEYHKFKIKMINVITPVISNIYDIVK